MCIRNNKIVELIVSIMFGSKMHGLLFGILLVLTRKKLIQLRFFFN